MPGSTYSTNLKVELMATGENSGTWGDITNTNLGTALEQAIVGYGNPDYASDANLTISITNSNAAQAARALVLNVTSSLSLTATRELVVPTIQKQYIVQNNTTGSQSITVKTSAGTGITVPNGRKAHLYVNGTDVIQMFDFVDINGGAIDGTPIGASSASTGAFTTLNASGATTLDGNVTLGNASGDNVTVTGTITSNLLFTDNTYDIGASGATRPRNLFLAGAATIGGNLSVGGTLTLTGGLILNGNVTVGDSSADTLTVNATITSNLLFTDNTYDIGASGATRPRNLFLAGNATIGGNQTLTGSLTVDSTTDSSSTTTGSIQTDGGLGVAKALYVGTTANIAGNVTLSGGTANGVAYLNASKVLTTGSALTFDGTSLTQFASTTGVLAEFRNSSSAAQNSNVNATNNAGVSLGLRVFGSAAGSYGMLSANSTMLYTSASELNFIADNASGAIKWGLSGATEQMRLTSTGLIAQQGAVFNESGADSDFRVESVGNTNMLFVDASASRVGVGVASPAYPLDVNGTANSTQGFTIGGDKYLYQGNQYSGSLAAADMVVAPAATGKFVVWASGTGQVLNANATGELVINEGSADYDFRVESDTSTHALFVDAGNSRVGINQSAPAYPLDVTGSVRSGSFGGIPNSSSQGFFGMTNDLGGNTGNVGLFLSAPYNAGTTNDGFFRVKRGSSDIYNGAEIGVTSVFRILTSTTEDTNERVRVGNSEMVVNEPGNDYDFRVESDTNAYALFLDAGQSRVYFGGATAPATGAPVLVTNGYAAVDTTTAGVSPSGTDITGTSRFSIGGAGGNYLCFGAYNDNVTAWIQSAYFVPNTAVYNMVLQPLGGNVGIGRYSTGAKLHVEAAPVNASLQIWQNSRTRASGNYYGVEFRDNADEANANIVVQQQASGNNAAQLEFYVNAGTGGNGLRNGVQALTLYPTVAVINEGSIDMDFRVESDTNTHAFFVDAGTNRVGLFTSAPASAFDSYVPTNEASVQRTVSDTNAAIAANLVESRVASFNVASGTNFVISNTAVSSSGWRVIFRGTWSNNYEGSGLEFYAPYIEVNSANPSTTIGSRTVTVSRNGSGFLIVNSGDTFRNSFAGTIEVYDNPQSQQPNQSMRLLGGIQFPATQNTSSNVNTLDDYEEGTWTPSFTSTGASFTYPRGQYGSYCKIGGLVYAQFYIGADATGTTSNQCNITGLPFNSANLNALAQASVAAWVSTTTSLGFTKNNNDNNITIWQQNVGSASVATASQCSGGYVVGHCVYRAS